MEEQRERPPHLLVTVVPYTVLAVLAVFTTVINPPEGTSPLASLGLCALTAAWMLGMFTLRPGWWDRPAVMGAYFAGLLALTAVLVARDPTFGFFTTAPYICAFAVLPWPWRMPAVAAVAVVAGLAMASNVDEPGPAGPAIHAVIIVGNIVIMVGLAWFLRADERERGELGRMNRLLAAALAENAELHDRLLLQARETGALDERRRMAREIHDTVTQGLIGIITQLQAAEGAREVPEEWHGPFEAVKGLARESLSEARRSVHALRPEQLETARLADALAGLAARCAALHGLDVQMTTTGTVRPMTADAEAVLLRTAQEALANVARHAGATRAGVTLSYLEDGIALDVRDDGRGFDPAATGRTGPGGYGLMIMRQRVEGLSGTLLLESEPGAGTGISAHIPTSPSGSHR
ncbi:sensor histidine kinase [Phytomonospora endophytica]|uniref:Oxygen sensor histidine kinase NreB n=1 Tax=Phytomonospora endophytica TaxID=714109 RepID=A0A841FAN7_9ACTN|nr:sensor histidine kinase [Phytomonospora endophytica]MBB6034321.1 signal transduction histidine kinase [Phytomonospora endophytica]